MRAAAFAFAGIALCAIAGDPPDKDEPKEIPFETIATGYIANPSGKREQWWWDQQGWQSFWEGIHKDTGKIPPLPAIDFEKETIVAVRGREIGASLQIKSAVWLPCSRGFERGWYHRRDVEIRYREFSSEEIKQQASGKGYPFQIVRLKNPPPNQNGDGEPIRRVGVGFVRESPDTIEHRVIKMDLRIRNETRRVITTSKDWERFFEENWGVEDKYRVIPEIDFRNEFVIILAGGQMGRRFRITEIERSGDVRYEDLGHPHGDLVAYPSCIARVKRSEFAFESGEPRPIHFVKEED